MKPLIETITHVLNGTYLKESNANLNFLNDMIKPLSKKGDWIVNKSKESLQKLIVNKGKMSKKDFMPTSTLKAKTFKTAYDQMIDNEVIEETKIGRAVFVLITKKYANKLGVDMSSQGLNITQLKKDVKSIGYEKLVSLSVHKTLGTIYFQTSMGLSNDEIKMIYNKVKNVADKYNVKFLEISQLRRFNIKDTIIVQK